MDFTDRVARLLGNSHGPATTSPDAGAIASRLDRGDAGTARQVKRYERAARTAPTSSRRPNATSAAEPDGRARTPSAADREPLAKQLDLEIGADVAGGYDPMTRRPREPLDSADELFLHRGLEGVAGTITSMTCGAGAARHAAASEHGLAPERAVVRQVGVPRGGLSV
jgi:hypothetical protein